MSNVLEITAKVDGGVFESFAIGMRIGLKVGRILAFFGGQGFESGRELEKIKILNRIRQFNDKELDLIHGEEKARLSGYATGVIDRMLDELKSV